MCLGGGGRGGRYEAFKISSWNWKINRKIKEDQGGDKHCEQKVGGVGGGKCSICDVIV